MKKYLLGVAVPTLLVSAGIVSADVYTDTLGENFDGNGHMDIASVEVTNTLTDITFKVTINGTIPPDWGKYCVGIDSVPGGDTGTPVGNPWGRNIRIGAGMDAWIGSWADGGGGAQPFTYAAGSWTQNGQFAPVIGANSTTLTVPLASLGLSLAQPFFFDVYTTGGGGGDSANDALGNPLQTINDWQVPYDSGQNLEIYTVAVPEPTALGAIALGALATIGRRRRA